MDSKTQRQQVVRLARNGARRPLRIGCDFCAESSLANTAQFLMARAGLETAAKFGKEPIAR